MEELSGSRGTYHDGIFFTEDAKPDRRLPGSLIKVEISRQNANLRLVKAELAAKVRAAGGNALVGFHYGQRSHGILQQLLTFKWDTESWHGEGFAASLPDHPGGPDSRRAGSGPGNQFYSPW